MSGSARSQRLLAYTSTAAGNSPAFQCPAGHVVLVKQATFHCHSAVAGISSLLLYIPSLALGIQMFKAELAQYEFATWDGWVVLNPQDLVYADFTEAGISVWVSGAVLTGDPPLPPADRNPPFQTADY